MNSPLRTFSVALTALGLLLAGCGGPGVSSSAAPPAIAPLTAAQSLDPAKASTDGSYVIRFRPRQLAVADYSGSGFTVSYSPTLTSLGIGPDNCPRGDPPPLVIDPAILPPKNGLKRTEYAVRTNPGEPASSLAYECKLTVTGYVGATAVKTVSYRITVLFATPPPRL